MGESLFYCTKKATNGSRTRDLNITNVALYHLSYSSLLSKSNNNYNKTYVKNQAKYLFYGEKYGKSKYNCGTSGKSMVNLQ